MAPPRKLDLTAVIDQAPVGVFQFGIFFLCGICLVMDGFDVQSMGYVGPAIIKNWGIASSVLGPVFSAALVGVLLGSLGFSMLADRIGRRPVIIAATLFFSLMTFLTARATAVEDLRIIRLIAGIGLGGIMPNVVALCGEFSPRRSRVTIMMIVANGFNLGAAFGGFIAAWLIPNYGWRSVFLFGAAVPLVIALMMLIWLPESPQFLGLRAHTAAGQARLAKIMRRIAPGNAPEARESEPVEYTVREVAKGGVPIVKLFGDGRALGTLLIWITNFMNLLNLYFLSQWLPTVVSGAGYDNRTAVLVGTTLQVGGTIGTVVLGWLVGQHGIVRVLGIWFAFSALGVALIGQPGLPLLLLYTIVFIAGFGIVGGQAAVNALSATYYPTELRSTGIGAGLGIGRFGAIVGPLLAGQMIAWKWTSRELFLAAAVPAAISAIVMVAMRWVMPRQTAS